MRFATQADGSLDGALLLVPADGARAVPPAHLGPDLMTFRPRRDERRDAMRALAAELEDGIAEEIVAFDTSWLAVPLSRCPPRFDASAFPIHQRPMAQAFGTPPIPHCEAAPEAYERTTDDFPRPDADMPFADEAGGIDFEGEFGVGGGAAPVGAIERYLVPGTASA